MIARIASFALLLVACGGSGPAPATPASRPVRLADHVTEAEPEPEVVPVAAADTDSGPQADPPPVEPPVFEGEAFEGEALEEEEGE